MTPSTEDTSIKRTARFSGHNGVCYREVPLYSSNTRICMWLLWYYNLLLVMLMIDGYYKADPLFYRYMIVALLLLLIWKEGVSILLAYKRQLMNLLVMYRMEGPLSGQFNSKSNQTCYIFRDFIGLLVQKTLSESMLRQTHRYLLYAFLIFDNIIMNNYS